MQILTSVRNERSLHRAERVNPTTRSWIPPRTFFTQVHFSRSGNFSPRPGSPTPPSGPENAGQKGQKSRRQDCPESRPGGLPRGPAATPLETPQRRGKPGPPAGRKPGPTNRPRGHLKASETRESSDPAASKIPRHTPAPARKTVSPAGAEYPLQDLQPPPEHAGARRRGRENGPVMTRTPGQPGAPTRPAGEEKTGTPPPARGSPTSSERRNQTASRTGEW